MKATGGSYRDLHHVQTLPDRQTGFLFKCGPVLSPHLGGVHIGRGLRVGFGKHRHDAQEDLLYALDRGPSLAAGLVAQGIIAGGMEDTGQQSVEVEVRGWVSVRISVG